AQVDAGPGTGRQVRRKDIGADRTEKTAPREREEAGPEAPPYPQRSFATRSIYEAILRRRYPSEHVSCDSKPVRRRFIGRYLRILLYKSETYNAPHPRSSRREVAS